MSTLAARIPAAEPAVRASATTRGITKIGADVVVCRTSGDPMGYEVVGPTGPRTAAAPTATDVTLVEGPGVGD